MATPFLDIYETVDGKLTDTEKTRLTSNKRKELLKVSYPKIKPYFRELTIDYNNELIEEDLDETEILIFSLYIVLEYYRQEKIKYSKITNMVSDSTRITGFDSIRKVLDENYTDIEKEIDNILSTLL